MYCCFNMYQNQSGRQHMYCACSSSVTQLKLLCCYEDVATWLVDTAVDRFDENMHEDGWLDSTVRCVPNYVKLWLLLKTTSILSQRIKEFSVDQRL